MLIETGVMVARGSDKIEFNPQMYLQEKVIIRHLDAHQGRKMRRTGGAAM
jgi:hypothetical protein